MTAVDVDALDKLREALAAVTLSHRVRAILGFEIECACGWVGGYHSAHLAHALLPAVDRIAKDRAADEIRSIAHRLDDGGEESAAVIREGSAYVHRVLCDTAHALDGKP